MAQREDEIINRILRLENLNLPERPRVVALTYYTDIDSTGDPAIHIRIKLDDRTAKKDLDWKRFEAIKEVIRAALRKAGVERWPYFWFGTESEWKEAG